MASDKNGSAVDEIFRAARALFPKVYCEMVSYADVQTDREFCSPFSNPGPELH